LDPGAVAIEALGGEGVERHRGALIALLTDAVDSGASVGFLPPLAEAEADAYWKTVAAAVREGTCVLLVARVAEGADAGEGDVVGTAQLLLATRPNARHRAEVAKVIVHTKARRRGLGRALMLAVEDRARRPSHSIPRSDTAWPARSPHTPRAPTAPSIRAPSTTGC